MSPIAAPPAEAATYRRIIRRERHNSRSVAVSITLALVALGLAYVTVELVLGALELPALLVAPVDAVAVLNEPTVPVIAGSAVAVAIGLVLLIIALAPGRRARHEIPNTRMAVVVDDVVLAGALGRAGRVAASVPAQRVRTTVTARRALVSITPTSGIEVDAEATEAATSRVAAELAAKPPLTVSVSIAQSGVVGS
ncbi:signal transduction histidine kinase [Salinibacterium sp. CAN_S4]|uniref:hypothetical protein n=1 Tax=Salinibacterium sp. CAN_S4 TaxID=2787727 RepID=UPI0018EF480F